MPDLHPDQAITQAFIRIAKSASGNKVGALLDAAAAFRTGSIAEKLESLSDMKSLDNSSITDGLQAVQLRQLKYGNATILAEHGPLPVHIMGQQKTLADLNTAFADELQRVYLSAVLAKLVQAGEPFAFSNFSSFVRYTHLSAADTLQQRGACQLYLGKPAEAVADLTAALQQGNPSWLTYHYRAAAHEALGNDKAAAEDKAEESRIAPDPDFVTLAFPLESHDFEMMEVHGQQNWLSLRERQYMLAVAGDNPTYVNVKHCLV